MFFFIFFIGHWVHPQRHSTRLPTELSERSVQNHAGLLATTTITQAAYKRSSRCDRQAVGRKPAIFGFGGKKYVCMMNDVFCNEPFDIMQKNTWTMQLYFNIVCAGRIAVPASKIIWDAILIHFVHRLSWCEKKRYYCGVAL